MKLEVGALGHDVTPGVARGRAAEAGGPGQWKEDGHQHKHKGTHH